MMLSDFNNRKYIEELALDKEKFLAAVDGDIGVIYAKFKEFDVYPPVDFLKSVDDIKAKLFLLENYHLSEKDKISLISNHRGGSFLIKSSDIYKKHYSDYNSADFNSFKFVDYAGIKGSSFNLPNELELEEKMLKYLENTIIRVFLGDRNKNVATDIIKNIWERVFVKTSEYKRNLMFSNKKIRELYNLGFNCIKISDIGMSINLNILFSYWNHEFDLRQLKKIHNLNGNDIISVFNKAQKIKPEITSNDIYCNLNEKEKLLIIKSDLFADFSNDNLSQVENIGISEYFNSVFCELENHYKSKDFLFFDNIYKLIEHFKWVKAYNDENKSPLIKKMKEIIPIIEKINKSLIGNDKLFSLMLGTSNGVISSINLDMCVNLMDSCINSTRGNLGEYSGALNDLIHNLLNGLIHTPNIHFSYLEKFNIPLGYFKSTSLEKNELEDLYNLNKFVLLKCHTAKDLPVYYYDFCEKNPQLVKDFQDFLINSTIDLDSQLFKDEMFQVDKPLNKKFIESFNRETREKLIKKYPVNYESFYNLHEFTVFSAISTETEKMIVNYGSTRNFNPSYFQVLMNRKFEIENESVSIRDCHEFIERDLPDFLNKSKVFNKLVKDGDVSFIGSNVLEYDSLSIFDDKSYVVFDFFDAKSLLKRKFYKINDKLSSDYKTRIVNKLNYDMNNINAFIGMLSLDVIRIQLIDFIILSALHNNKLNNLSVDFLSNSFKKDFNEKDFFSRNSLDSNSKMTIFNSVFRKGSDLIHVKNQTNLIFKENLSSMFPVLEDYKKAFNQLIENNPAIVLSDKYTFVDYKRHPNASLEMLLKLFKGADEDFGIYWPRSNQSHHLNLLCDEISLKGEKDFFQALDWSKKEMPSLYSLFLSKVILSRITLHEGDVLGKHFQKWSNDVGAGPGDLWDYACFLADPQDVILSFSSILEDQKKALKNIANEIDVIKFPSTAFKGDSFFVSSYLADKSLYPDKVNEFASLLLKKDIAFLSPLVSNNAILPYVKDLMNIVDESVKTTEDFLKIITLNVINTEISSNNKKQFIAPNINYYQLGNPFYQEIITYLLNNKEGFIDGLEYVVESINMDDSLDTSSCRTLSDFFQKRSYDINNIFMDFKTSGYDIKSLPELIRNKNIIIDIFNAYSDDGKNQDDETSSIEFKI